MLVTSSERGFCQTSYKTISEGWTDTVECMDHAAPTVVLGGRGQQGEAVVDSLLTHYRPLRLPDFDGDDDRQALHHWFAETFAYRDDPERNRTRAETSVDWLQRRGPL
jgi:hypothetical protein